MKKKTFELGIALLSKTFPNHQFDVKFMWHFLKDLGDSEFLRAIESVITTMKELYPGTNLIATIRERALPRYPSPTEAWEEVRTQLNFYKKPVFSCELIKRAVEAVGWADMCLSEDVGLIRTHFLRAYEILLEREKEKQMTGIKALPKVKDESN